MPLDVVQTWLLIGAGLFAIEFLVPLPTVFVAGALGVGAVIIALITWIATIPLTLQIILWLVISSVFVWYSRRWLPKSSYLLNESTIGVVTTEILAGHSGRVKCDGVSWRAICDDPTLSIGVNVKVQILGKNGTTLIILPEEYINRTESNQSHNLWS